MVSGLILLVGSQGIFAAPHSHIPAFRRRKEEAYSRANKGNVENQMKYIRRFAIDVVQVKEQYHDLERASPLCDYFHVEESAMKCCTLTLDAKSAVNNQI